MKNLLHTYFVRSIIEYIATVHTSTEAVHTIPPATTREEAIVTEKPKRQLITAGQAHEFNMLRRTVGRIVAFERGSVSRMSAEELAQLVGEVERGVQNLFVDGQTTIRDICRMVSNAFARVLEKRGVKEEGKFLEPRDVAVRQF